jgi:ABC-2 type transport system permease protein
LEELPLGKNENQGYIHYSKGSVVMYYLKEMIGEEHVNQALRNFLDKFRYAEPPYPVTTDLVSEFEKQTPDSLKYIVDDLFWDITLFENRTTEVSMTELDNGQYEITLKTESRKLKADGQGKEEKVEINDWIDIGVFAKPEKKKKYGKTLYRQRVKIDSPENTFTFIVDEKPHSAGIDPFRLLIDRNPEDNIRDF